MAKRPGFKNIQIQAKQDLAELFEDTFNQSDANNKPEFLRMLVDNYLDPDASISAIAENVEKEKNELSGQLQTVSKENEELENENTVLKERIKHYENDILTKAFTKNKGKKLKFRSTSGKKIELEIKDLKDAYTAIIHSIDF